MKQRLVTCALYGSLYVIRLLHLLSILVDYVHIVCIFSCLVYLSFQMHWRRVSLPYVCCTQWS